MNQMMQIQNQEIQVKEFNGQRVVTFKDIDLVHERPSGTASRNFRANRKHFTEGEDFFKICADEIRCNNILDISHKAHQDIVLITESGYLMLVKSFTDDLAWAVQRQLVNCYFKVKEACEQVEVEETTLTMKDRIKVMEILSNSSQYVLPYVLDLAKPFLSEGVMNIVPSATTTVKMKISPDFSKKLVEWMTSNGLNQEQLRKVLGLPKSTVSTYCHGGATPRVERMKDIAERLKVSIDYFLD